MTRIVFSIAIGRSNKLLCYLVLAHSVMLATLVSLLAMSGWSLLAFVLLSISFIYYCRQTQWLMNARMRVRLERDSDKKWYLTTHHGELSQPLQLKSCVVLASIVLLRFSKQGDNKERSIVLVDDAVDAHLFRQLRVYCLNPATFQQ